MSPVQEIGDIKEVKEIVSNTNNDQEAVEVKVTVAQLPTTSPIVVSIP